MPAPPSCAAGNGGSMQARDVMTTNVATVSPDTPTREVAKLLLARRISAVPVLAAGGEPVGMVSEGDLVGRDATKRAERRDWWLELLAEGTTLAPTFVQFVAAADRPVSEVMATPVVTVCEDTDVAEIVRLLEEHRIKRVPVVRGGRVVGIVSRADLLRAFATPRPA
jgi:CBS domain-containing protein